MKRQYIHFFLLSALLMQIHSIHAMNYLQSAYEQVVATGQNIKNQAQKVKNSVQQFQQSLFCVQSTLGCSAEQSMYITNLLRNINLSLMPLRNLPANIASKLQKPIDFIQNKVSELQSYIAQGLDRLTKEQKEAFISGAKKMVLAAAAIIAIAALIAVGRAVTGSKEQVMASEKDFVAAFVQKDVQFIKDNMDKVSLQALLAARSAINADKNYPQRSSLLSLLSIEIHKREAFPQAYEPSAIRPITQAELDMPLPSGTPDEQFIRHVQQKNISVIDNWLENDMPTIYGLQEAEKIIAINRSYPNGNALLGKIRQRIHAKQYASDVRRSLGI